MAIVTMKEINAQFSAIVNDYLSKGWVLSPFTSGGSYSDEFGHVDLLHPNHKSIITRIWLINGWYSYDDTKDKHWNSIHTLVINAREYVWDRSYTHHTLWQDRGTSVLEKTFYEVRSNKCYSDNPEDVIRFNNISHKRFIARHVKSDDCTVIDVSKLSRNFITSVMDRITSQRGFKRARVENIKKISLQRDYSGRLKAYVNYEYNDKRGSIVFK